MTDGGAAFEPGRGEPPFRPRGAYVGHEVFGHGDGAVLVDPEVARDLRSAAESASQERRIAGGLLYGRMLADDEGKYLVIDGFLEAGPGENPGDRISREGRDSFTLSDADLELLREDATRMYPAALEVGWWRTLPGQGEFSPRDFETQRELVGPGGAGLLVFGEGLEWGTAYLGPDGRVPDSARSFIPVPRPATEAPLVPTRELGLVPGTVLEPDGDLEPDSAGDLEPAPEPAAATAGGIARPRAIAGVGRQAVVPELRGREDAHRRQDRRRGARRHRLRRRDHHRHPGIERARRRDRRRGGPARDRRLPVDVAVVRAAPLVARVAVEELVDVHVVHAGEHAGRQDGQHVGVRAGRRPGHSLPALGERGGRALAAVAVRAA